MAKIFVTRKIPGEALGKFEGSGHEVLVSQFDRPLSPGELIEGAKGADALLVLLTDKIDGEVIDAIGPELKIVSNYAVGFDNIKVEELTSKGVVITNTPSDEVNEAVAEHTWALALSLVRRVVEADEAVKRGAYMGWEPDIFLGKSLVGKTFGIIGLGRIGSMVARRAKEFGVKVVYFSRTRDEEAEKSLGVEYRDLDPLFSESDIVSLHIPLTEETRHMINSETIAKMKKGVYIINTARGAIINESDLVEALRDGQVGGAALDVFDAEPNINPELIGMENVVLTPHISSATKEARDKMGNQAVTAILDTLKGQKPENFVNPEVWTKRRV